MQYLRRRASLIWSNAGLPSYSYVFDVTVNGLSDYIGATHFQEVAFVFNNTLALGYNAQPDPFEGEPASYYTLAKTMSTAWVNFFVSLDPNGASGLNITGVPSWPVYNASAGGGVGYNIVWNVNGSYLERDTFRAEGMQWMIDNSLTLFGN